MNYIYCTDGVYHKVLVVAVPGMYGVAVLSTHAWLQINKVFQQFVKRVQQDVWERDFGSVPGCTLIYAAVARHVNRVIFA